MSPQVHHSSVLVDGPLFETPQGYGRNHQAGQALASSHLISLGILQSSLHRPQAAGMSAMREDDPPETIRSGQ